MIEICCGSFEDVLTAYQAGASQVELNSALSLGGLSPRLVDLKKAVKLPGLTTIAMVRPRGGGFVYTQDEYQSMLEEAESFLCTGAQGLAFGFLTADNKIDLARTQEMVHLIHSFKGQAVFHRAIDLVANYEAAIETLIHLGVDRVLTSGQAQVVGQAVDRLAFIQAQYSQKIQLLMGSGINEDNVSRIIEQTQCSNVHASCKNWAIEPGYDEACPVDFSLPDAPQKGMLSAVDGKKVRTLIEAVGAYTSR